MSATIWKFVLPTYGDGFVDMPAGARIVHVREQNGSLCIWAMVDIGAPAEPRRFLVVETGTTFVSEGYAYLGTCFLDRGAYVVHVFERTSA